jgi:hypothetical protein
MPTIEEWALRSIDDCVTVPSAGDGVCLVCHNRPQGSFTRCWSCNNIRGQLLHPCPRVVPISLCRRTNPPKPKEPATGLQLYHMLRRYKSDFDPDARQYFSARLATVLGWFLEKHWACLAGLTLTGKIDVITVVPSTRPGRAGQLHPLHLALGMLTGLPAPVEVLLGVGPQQITHKEASDQGYVPNRDVKGMNVLIVDDTYTSGSHGQSAASALTLAGANVVAIVPIGRLIDPDYVPVGVEPEDADNRKYWRRQLATPFSFDRCCLEP